jgi:hypothetical protein
MTEKELPELQKKIDMGVKKAIAEAIEKHRLLGQSISVERDGKVITIPADQIPPLKQNYPENQP